MICHTSILVYFGFTIFASSVGFQILPEVDPYRVFDQELYKSVLDPELCAKQLQYIQNEDLTLQLQFLDSGLRLPRGILQGNLIDLGNFHQCLSINKEVEDMIIQGKHCLINIPLDFLPLQNNYDHLRSTNDYAALNETQFSFIQKIQKEKELLLAKDGKERIGDMDTPNIPGFSLSLTLSVCIPQTCTTQDVLDSILLNLTENIGVVVRERSCRLPNDKPFVAADYIAWVVFSMLGLIAILSTMYDVQHTLILKKDPKEANELYSAFSLYKNSCKIINLTTRPGTIECLDGIRALSILWVVFGHTFLLSVYYPANPLDLFEWYTSTKALAIKSAETAVDTFFLLSGLLVVYTTASKFTPMKLLKNLHLFYLHRYLRLLPVLAVVILFVSSIQHHLGDGAVRFFSARDVVACRSYWWLPLLHLQNFLTPVGTCVGESWYMAIDMQLHIISPIVLFWILTGSKKPAWIALISTFVISLTASTIYIFLKDLSENDDFLAYYYVNILTRAPPFFVGLIYGYLLHLYRDKKCGLPKTVGYPVTGFALCLAGLVIYGCHIRLHGDITVTIQKVFLSFEKTIWAVCVGWIIFACANGYAAPINWFLSMSVWKIPSRISYSMYLCHMTMFKFMSFLYLTLFVAFFMTALIDLPFATLFRILLSGEKKKRINPDINEVDEVKIGVPRVQEGL